MDYEGFFREEIEGLRREGRYRIFADIERRAGQYPRALRHGAGFVRVSFIVGVSLLICKTGWDAFGA